MPLQQVTGNEIAAGSIVASDLAAGSITGDLLSTNIINANNIVAGSVTGDKIGLTAINANNVVSGTFATPGSATTYTANQTFTVANVTNQLLSFGSASQNIIRLTDGATITANLAQSCSFVVTLGGNRTLANGTNFLSGQSGVIFVQQDGTGSRTLSFGTGWRFPSNTAPTLTTTAHAVDMIVFTAWNTSNIAAQAVLNVT